VVGAPIAWTGQSAFLALVELSDTSRATVLDHAAAPAYVGGQHGAAREYVEAGLDLQQRRGTIREAALSLNHLATILRWGHADADAAQAVYYRSFSAAVQSGDRPLIAPAVMPLGTLALDRMTSKALR
jgi:hypothetical protein